MSRELSWKPEHKAGGVYCSPACGHNCKLRDHDNAIKKAIDLNKELKNFGWKPHVWENLGWHYCIKRGDNQIHRSNDGMFISFIYLGGCQFVAKCKTPKKALKESIRMAHNRAKDITKDIEVLGT